MYPLCTPYVPLTFIVMYPLYFFIKSEHLAQMENLAMEELGNKRYLVSHVKNKDEEDDRYYVDHETEEVHVSPLVSVPDTMCPCDLRCRFQRIT